MRHLKPKTNIIELEKKIFLEHKRIINDSAQVTDKSFKSYYRHYNTSLKSYKSVVSMSQMLAACHKAEVILVGDYHTLDQSQRSLLRLMRYHLKRYPKDKLVLALETLQTRHQKILDSYMNQEISSDEFIKKIGFKKHWFFDLWKNYEILFDFAKHHKIKIVAIDADHRNSLNLKQRDEHMAHHLVLSHQKYPQSHLYVLVGDLHLAPLHLPKQIKLSAKKQALKPLEQISLYQNSPEIYFKLAEKHLSDHTDVVQVRQNEYCRMHTPPLIVQQSYLNWLYHEEGSFDWADAKTNFLGLVKQICSILNFKVPPDIENIEVYTCSDFSFLTQLKRSKKFSDSELKFVNDQVRNEESCFMPRARMVYIANVSIHHAAEEASHYLKFLMSGEEFLRSRKDAFYANVLHEALGFFGSKLINPKRKCPRYKDFVQEKTFLEKANLTHLRTLDYETSLGFLDHHRKIKKAQTYQNAHVALLTSKLFLALTHAIGYDLGDHLYFGFIDGKFSKQEFKILFQNAFEADGQPAEIYLNLIQRLKSVKRPQYL